MAAAQGVSMSFERDLDAYIQALPRLLPTEAGRFALVGRAELAGIHDTREAALSAGYSRYGVKGFLVREIQGSDLELCTQWRETCRS